MSINFLKSFCEFETKCVGLLKMEDTVYTYARDFNYFIGFTEWNQANHDPRTKNKYPRLSLLVAVSKIHLLSYKSTPTRRFK